MNKCRNCVFAKFELTDKGRLVTTEEINITDKDRKAAMAMLQNAPSMSLDDALIEYQSILDSYCSRFDATSLDDLMSRADELEFEPQICAEILEKYSFIQRHQA
jgi:hypothetical protein